MTKWAQKSTEVLEKQLKIAEFFARNFVTLNASSGLDLAALRPTSHKYSQRGKSKSLVSFTYKLNLMITVEIFLILLKIQWVLYLPQSSASVWRQFLVEGPSKMRKFENVLRRKNVKSYSLLFPEISSSEIVVATKTRAEVICNTIWKNNMYYRINVSSSFSFFISFMY